jgi:hypothetical protein
MLLPFEVRLLLFCIQVGTCNTLEDFVGCLFWALGKTGRIRFSTVEFSVIVEFSVCSAGLTLFLLKFVCLHEEKSTAGRIY